VRIGLFYQIQVPKPWTPSSESQRIYEALEQIPYAEQVGFESVWFSEHHFRPVWSHNSAPDLTLAAVSQRTSRIRLGIGVVLAPIHHPLHVAARMATLDILSHGRVDVGLGRTGYPYQITPYGADLQDTRGMWQEFADVLPRIWTQRERARLVWRDYDPTTVPPDYQGYYARDQRLASGPHPGEPTPEQVREEGTKFCVGTPADCIRFLEMYEALGIEEVFLLCAIGPAQHEEVLHTIRLFGEQVIPHFQARERQATMAQSLA
jgi:alkanesulfonate monooxygenase SsuD/methylene tetrahydromethanopterin reductase-like flavin-dependent oxidoreductase (luciferase family)